MLPVWILIMFFDTIVEVSLTERQHLEFYMPDTFEKDKTWKEVLAYTRDKM